METGVALASRAARERSAGRCVLLDGAACGDTYGDEDLATLVRRTVLAGTRRVTKYQRQGCAECGRASAASSQNDHTSAIFETASTHLQPRHDRPNRDIASAGTDVAGLDIA